MWHFQVGREWCRKLKIEHRWPVTHFSWSCHIFVSILRVILMLFSPPQTKGPEMNFFLPVYFSTPPGYPMVPPAFALHQGPHPWCPQYVIWNLRFHHWSLLNIWIFKVSRCVIFMLILKSQPWTILMINWLITIRKWHPGPYYVILTPW